VLFGARVTDNVEYGRKSDGARTLGTEVVVSHSKFGQILHLINEEAPCFLWDVKIRQKQGEDRKSNMMSGRRVATP
jgi:hypothetical protein